MNTEELQIREAMRLLEWYQIHENTIEVLFCNKKSRKEEGSILNTIREMLNEKLYVAVMLAILSNKDSSWSEPAARLLAENLMEEERSRKEILNILRLLLSDSNKAYEENSF